MKRNGENQYSEDQGIRETENSNEIYEMDVPEESSNWNRKYIAP